MKRFLVLFPFLSISLITLVFISTLCAGSKCHYKMVCGGNSNIKATVCTTDCNSSESKEKAKKWFKSECSSASLPSSSHSGWDNCDVTL